LLHSAARFTFVNVLSGWKMRRGIKLRRSGKELIGFCPFHDDKNPSLNIDPKKNEWHCKGACGEGGDVIQWVMR
jgi:DNA primase